MQLKGIIHIPVKAGKIGGLFYIQVQDTSLMDMPAKTISTLKINHKAGQHQASFDFALPEKLNPSATYTLFVHLDLDNDGQLSTGDWLHDRAYRVIFNDGRIEPIEVRLMEIS